MSRKILTRIAFIPATFYSVSLLLSSFPGSQKEVWQGDREVLWHLRKTLEFVFQKERISATGGKKLLVSWIKGVIFTWCCGYVLVTLCQKILGLKETSETRSLIWCLMPSCLYISPPKPHLLWLSTLSVAEEHTAGQDHPPPSWAALITRMCFFLSNWDLFSCFSHPRHLFCTLLLYLLTYISDLKC